MTDKSDIRVKFEIGEIKFEAEGSAELVERERSIFTNTLLPSAIEAIVRTRGSYPGTQMIDTSPTSNQLESGEIQALTNGISIYDDAADKEDLSRTSLASFIKKYGALTEQDFILFSAYFDEKKNGSSFFSKTEAEKFYDEARRAKPANISMGINQLAQKGYIIDAPDVDQKSPKPYRISSDGFEYIKTYVPKEGKEKRAVKARQTHKKTESAYSEIDLDSLNLGNYPAVNSLKDFKDKMMLVLYIVTNEHAGEWFTTTDVICLMTDIFGEAATVDQINGVFKRNKLWFKSESVDGNKRNVKRKLLNQGSEYARSIFITGE